MLIKFHWNGKEINLTSDNVTIKSSNFNVDKNGNMSCNNANVTGGNILLQDDGTTTQNTSKLTIKHNDNIYAFLKSTAFRFYNSNLGRIECFIHPSGGTSFQMYNYLQGGNIVMHTYDNDPSVSLNGQGQNTTINATGITTPSVTQTSREENKKNFEKLENGLDIIKATDIYKYNLKNQADGDKKHIGFVIGKDYNYSHEITAENEDEEVGVDTYSMISVAYKAIQEQQEIIETLQRRIQELEGKANGEN